MRSMQSLCLYRVVPFLAAAALLVACSSDKVTGPQLQSNDELIAHFDSLAQVSGGDQTTIYYSTIQMLVNGAPAVRGTISVDGQLGT